MEDKSTSHWRATAVPSLDGGKTTLIVEGRVKMGIVPARLTVCQHDIKRDQNEIGFDLNNWGGGILYPIYKKVDISDRPELETVIIYDGHDHKIVAKIPINRDVHSFASDPDAEHDGGVVSGG